MHKFSAVHILANKLLFLHGAFLAEADGAASFNLWATFARAELFGKVIVVMLLFFSLLAWTVMIGKYLDLSRWRALNLSFQSRLKQAGTFMGQSISAGMRQSGPYARLFHDAIEAGRQHRAGSEEKIRLSLIENALQRGVAAECVRYETKMVLLGSLVSGAPFIGLLGTVWGVMVAFSGMAQPGSASLQNMAPGVASALLATVSGLLVAIPSVFGYNFLLTQVKMMITELENYASWLADRIELEMESQKISPVQTAPIPLAPVPSALPTQLSMPVVEAAAPAIPVVEPPAEPTVPGDPAVAAAERYLRFDVTEQD